MVTYPGDPRESLDLEDLRAAQLAARRRASS
jgi:hypothetical protein